MHVFTHVFSTHTKCTHCFCYHVAQTLHELINLCFHLRPLQSDMAPAVLTNLHKVKKHNYLLQSTSLFLLLLLVSRQPGSEENANWCSVLQHLCFYGCARGYLHSIQMLSTWGGFFCTVMKRLLIQFLLRTRHTLSPLKPNNKKHTKPGLLCNILVAWSIHCLTDNKREHKSRGKSSDFSLQKRDKKTAF